MSNLDKEETFGKTFARKRHAMNKLILYKRPTAKLIDSDRNVLLRFVTSATRNSKNKFVFRLTYLLEPWNNCVPFPKIRHHQRFTF